MIIYMQFFHPSPPPLSFCSFLTSNPYSALLRAQSGVVSDTTVLTLLRLIAKIAIIHKVGAGTRDGGSGEQVINDD